tara:strand:- start:1078 stop:1446 length:369 start_codon:yes stop_codon:yes gene_type:complete
MTPEVVMLLYDNKKMMVNMLLLPLLFAASVVALHFSESGEPSILIRLFVSLVPLVALMTCTGKLLMWVLCLDAATIAYKRFWRMTLLTVIVTLPALWEVMNHVDVCAGCYYQEGDDPFTSIE